MATSRIIDLNILPSEEENPMNELSENHEFLRNNFDLNADINFCGELSSQASGEFIRTDAIRVKPKSSYLKTRICSKWEITGQCPYGESCNFAHGQSELAALM